MCGECKGVYPIFRQPCVPRQPYIPTTLSSTTPYTNNPLFRHLKVNKRDKSHGSGSKIHCLSVDKIDLKSRCGYRVAG